MNRAQAPTRTGWRLGGENRHPTLQGEDTGNTAQLNIKVVGIFTKILGGLGWGGVEAGGRGVRGKGMRRWMLTSWKCTNYSWSEVLKTIRNEKTNANFMKTYKLPLIRGLKKTIRNEKMNANFMKTDKLSLIRGVKRRWMFTWCNIQNIPDQRWMKRWILTTHPFFELSCTLRATLHPVSYTAPCELHCTLWATLHPTELSCILLSYAEILLSYTTPYWAELHPPGLPRP